MSLTAYADADHAGCQDTRRSTSGSAQFLGDKLVSWSSKKQKCIAISSTEAEYIALLDAITNPLDANVERLAEGETVLRLMVNHDFHHCSTTKLDLELVPKENRFDIGKCNGRIPRGFSPREPTFQVILDAIALTPFHPAFLITADVPEVYMHQFWNCIYKHDDFYRFKIDKKKRFKLTLDVFRDILQIFPRVQGRDFDPFPSEKDTVSFLRDLGHTWLINSLNDVVVDQMHQPWRTFAALINRSLFGKTTGLDKLRLSRAQII
ncbi:uncharacterized mitochondrial protein-like protein [Tanacetum coccineum]|uniref:Uncharacterized mitochondrial protein-like protein n=1 Tax=Tanacetum coccineum TaxID=301880 RepID=A0ABQ4XBN4_9ASTR